MATNSGRLKLVPDRWASGFDGTRHYTWTIRGNQVTLGKSEITAHFASSPFYYIELASPGIHKVLHSYDVAGGRHTNGVLMTTKKFYEANPKVSAAVALETIKTHI